MNKTAVLAGGCFWVRSGLGPTSQDPASSFVSEVKQKSDRVYRSRREKEDNLIYYA
jgi:hypothetical protein